MTNKDIKDKIESEFGWLSPDEKYKMYVLVISVYNSAVVSSAQVASKIKIAEDEYREYHRHNSGANLLIPPDSVSASINTLKLKL